VGIQCTAHGATGSEAAKQAYLKYCSACHGSEGKGDGVVSGFMSPKPTDLTQLAKKAGGKFPFATVMQSIDGTASTRAHGDPDMPIWGEIFRAQAAGSLAKTAEVRGLVLMLTEHVQSIQAE